MFAPRKSIGLHCAQRTRQTMGLLHPIISPVCSANLNFVRSKPQLLRSARSKLQLFCWHTSISTQCSCLVCDLQGHRCKVLSIRYKTHSTPSHQVQVGLGQAYMCTCSSKVDLHNTYRQLQLEYRYMQVQGPQEQVDPRSANVHTCKARIGLHNVQVIYTVGIGLAGVVVSRHCRFRGKPTYMYVHLGQWQAYLHRNRVGLHNRYRQVQHRPTNQHMYVPTIASSI